MRLSHIPPEERHWRRLLRDFDRYPVEHWRILGLLGEPDLYSHSLYRLYVWRGGRARWWKAESNVGQIAYDPIAHQARIPKDRALPANRVVKGDARLIGSLICDPRKPGLVRLVTEIKRRLPHQASAP